MIDYATALARFLAGYWNAQTQTVANPGGFGANGHTENLPAVAEAIGVVAQEIAGQAGTASDDAATAAAAAGTASADAATATAAAATATTKAGEAAQSALDAAAAVGGLKVSLDDSTPGSLEDKLLDGPGISSSTQNPGANETRTFRVSADFANQARVWAATFGS